jgi:hypothetical protein
MIVNIKNQDAVYLFMNRAMLGLNVYKSFTDPKWRIEWEVIDRKLFFLSVIEHGIIFEELK